jgi:Zn-dependent protease with chaperone function
MSKRARLNRIFAIIFVVWGGAIITFGVAKGVPSGDTAYGAGQLVGFGFGFVILTTGVWSLTGSSRVSAGHDDFDDAPPRRGRRLALIVILPVLAIALGDGGVRLWHHLRERHADALAVRYGAAPSTGDVTSQVAA